MRQADQWLVGADEPDKPDKPPAGTEQMLKGPAIMPGLHQIMNSPGAGGYDGSPERWPAELPGDKIMDKLDDAKHEMSRIHKDML